MVGVKHLPLANQLNLAVPLGVTAELGGAVRGGSGGVGGEGVGRGEGVGCGAGFEGWVGLVLSPMIQSIIVLVGGQGDGKGLIDCERERGVLERDGEGRDGGVVQGDVR